ncbi:hypothetical protein [Alteromonas sp. M12]|uniref:hypothetical protein n=1 Tax=Alteromonas sp. M12 TaxID=3135644 RepID=UPI00319EAC03
MSVDPFIQMPESSQSINPYSYIMNNPMAGTDPTGYIGESANATTEQYTQTDIQKAEDISDKIFEKLEVDSNGNVFITAEGVEYKVKSIVKAGVASGAENGTVKGLNSDSGEVTKNIGKQEPSNYRDRSGNKVNVSEMSASNGSGIIGSKSEDLTKAQEMFMKEYKLSKSDFGSLINLVINIRQMGQLIEDKVAFNSAIEGMNKDQLIMFGYLIDASVKNFYTGLDSKANQRARWHIERVYRYKVMSKQAIFAGESVTNAMQLIYSDPAMRRIKNSLPSKVNRVLDRYDNFDRLYDTLETLSE